MKTNWKLYKLIVKLIELGNINKFKLYKNVIIQNGLL